MWRSYFHNPEDKKEFNMGFLKFFWKWYLSLGNKGHFLLPILGAIGSGALAAGKVAGTAALAGAKALGTGALAAGKAVGGTALGASKTLGSGIASAAKGMLGGAKVATPAMEAAKSAIVPGAQNIGMQAAGQIPGQVAAGTLGKTAGSGMLQAALKSIGQSTTDKKEQTAPAQPSIIGGEGPAVAPQITQFQKPPSMGELIAKMLQAKRGF